MLILYQPAWRERYKSLAFLACVSSGRRSAKAQEKAQKTREFYLMVSENSVIIGFAIILYQRNLRAVYCEVAEWREPVQSSGG
jgi:hypothetical protein